MEVLGLFLVWIGATAVHFEALGIGVALGILTRWGGKLGAELKVKPGSVAEGRNSMEPPSNRD